MNLYNLFKVFHLVEKSLWPFSVSFGFLSMTMGMVKYWYKKNLFLLYMSMFVLFFISLYWWKDVMKESFKGMHKKKVYYGLQLSMIFFMLSEVFFFFSFFWSYFHCCWSLSEEKGYNWPPIEYKKIVIDPFSIPLLNTMILLSSGVSMTLCHHSIMEKNFYLSFVSLFFTCFLGFYFLILQIKEYTLSYYSINSMSYGTIFFLLTGFHGLHVTVGAMFLTICFFRIFFNDFKKNYHVGFECAAWYWHFVDVVWMFLFFCIYWYGYY